MQADTQDIKNILMRIAGNKQRRKEIREQIKDVFSQNTSYVETSNQIAAIRSKKQQLEAEMMQTMPTEQEELDKLTLSINDDQQCLSDLAFSLLMKGQSIAIEGESVRYEPVIKIKYERQLKLF